MCKDLYSSTLACGCVPQGISARARRADALPPAVTARAHPVHSLVCRQATQKSGP